MLQLPVPNTEAYFIPTVAPHGSDQPILWTPLPDIYEKKPCTPGFMWLRTLDSKETGEKIFVIIKASAIIITWILLLIFSSNTGRSYISHNATW